LPGYAAFEYNVFSVDSVYLTAIIQRVLSASVTVDKEVISSIGRGVLVFAAVAPGDSEKEAQQIANKVIKMKLWDDEKGGRVSSDSFALNELPALKVF
jgi:hypothetical protein